MPLIFEESLKKRRLFNFEKDKLLVQMTGLKIWLIYLYYEEAG